MLDRSALEATAAPLLSPSRAAARRKRIGTAKLGNRDKRDPLPAIGPEPAVSGSDSARPLSQDPAKTRGFLGGSRGAAAKSLQPQTRWRREWDSNPRYPFGVHALSRRVPSAARPSLRTRVRRETWRRGGDSNPRYGFWPYNGLANRRLQPLGHLSAEA